MVKSVPVQNFLILSPLHTYCGSYRGVRFQRPWASTEKNPVDRTSTLGDATALTLPTNTNYLMSVKLWGHP